MRRMTISPSRLLPGFLAVVVTLGTATAQDTTTVRDTARVQDTALVRDTSRIAVPEGRTHVVQTGETLWGLAEHYMGDAFLWPAIYRLNTLVVEDPHWIFPGEELRLVPPDTTRVGPGESVVAPVAEAPTVDTAAAVASGQPGDTTQAVGRAPAPDVAVAELPPPPPPPGEGSGTVFTPRRRAVGPGVSGRTGFSLRALSPAQFYGAGFLTEGDRLPWAEVVGAVGKVTLGSLTSVTSARIFESIEIRAPAAASYRVGDSLLVAVLGREVSQWGQVVVPTGIARVRESSNHRVVADVVLQYGRLTSDNVAMPIEPFRNTGTTVPVPIDNGMTGKIIDVRDRHPVPVEMNIVFIDRGRDDGLTPGDIFEVLRPNPPEASPETPLQQVALLQIVHVRQRSASGQVIQMSSLGIAPGVPVRLIRKMPS